MTRTGIIFNRTFRHTINNLRWDKLPSHTIHEVLKDGRAFSYFIEPWLTQLYPLIHVKGYKDHDFIDTKTQSVKFDEKTFTVNGCKYVPSHMIGSGRKFNQDKFIEKANNLVYVIVSNINFPHINVKFVEGKELIKKYPKGGIPLGDHDKFFSK